MIQHVSHTYARLSANQYLLDQALRFLRDPWLAWELQLAPAKGSRAERVDAVEHHIEHDPAAPDICLLGIIHTAHHLWCCIAVPEMLQVSHALNTRWRLCIAVVITMLQAALMQSSSEVGGLHTHVHGCASRGFGNAIHVSFAETKI